MRLNDWLDHCARHGLDVGLRERLLAHGLVQRLKLQNTWPATASERLRCLGPLLCHNPQQQADYTQLVLLQAKAPAMAAAAVGALGDAAQARSHPGRPWRLAQALLLLALLATALLLLGPCFNPQPALKGLATPASAAVLPAGAIVTPASATVTSASAAITPASGGLQIDPGSTRLGAVAAGLTGGPDAPVYMSPRHIPALQPQGPAWVAPIRWAMAVLAALSAAFTGWRLWRWQRRRLYAQADAVPEDQLVQTVLRDPQAQPLAPRTRVLAPLSRLLRQRVVSDGQQLAGRATVQASIRQGGLLALRFAPRSRLPEYLALIERNGEQDHQSRYHEAMVSALQQRGVPVEVFFYRHNPGDACWRLRAATPAAARPAGLVEGERTPHDRQGLAALMARYPRHRLLVLGDAAAAVHPHTGQPADWTRLVRPMGQRAWFTPLPLPDWGSVEAWVTSAQGLDFLLLPMEEAALHTWADWLASGRAHLQQDPRAPACYPPLLRESADAWAVRTVAPPTAVLQRLLQELRSYLGPQGMQWLAACAIFPLLSWPLTLALGRRLLQAQAKTPAAAVPDDSALALGAGALGALPWFRHGRLPDWLRAPLLAELPPDTAQLLREELQTRLARAASGQGEAIASVARLKGLLRRGSGALVDVLLLRFIEPALASPLAQALPETLRRWLFPQGSALLGLRPGVAWLAAAPMLLALSWLPPVWRAVAPQDELPLVRATLLDGRNGVAAFSLTPDGQAMGLVNFRNTALVKFYGTAERAALLMSSELPLGTGAPVGIVIGPWAELAVLSAPPGGGAHGSLTSSSLPTAKESADGVAGTTAFSEVNGAPTALAVTSTTFRINSVPMTPTVTFAGKIYFIGTKDGSLLSVLGHGGVPISSSAHSGGVLALVARPDGGQIASVGGAPELKLWSSQLVDGHASVERILQLSGAPGRALAYSPDGTTLAAGAASGSVWLFNPQQGTAAGALAAEPAHTGAMVTALAYSADGQRLAAGHATGQVTVWDLATGRRVLRGQVVRADLGAARAVVKTLQFSPDGTTLWLLDDSGQLQHIGQAPADNAVAVLDCEAQELVQPAMVTGRNRSRVDELNSLLDAADTTTAGSRNRPAVLGLSTPLWRAWGHGNDPPGPGELLVPADPASQARGQALLALLNKLGPVASATDGGVGLPGWQLRSVASGLRTITVNACAARTAPPIPPVPVADERLAGVPWPSQPADAQRQQALRSALASIWQPQRDQRPQATAQIIAQAELLSDLLPLALTQAQGLDDGKDPGSLDAQSRITQTLRLAQAASAVTLQRHAAQVYRLLDKVQALSPVTNTEAAALRARLLAVRGSAPLVLIEFVNPALRTQAQTLQTRLQAQGLRVRFRSAPDAFNSAWQPFGFSDRALGRWVAAEAGRVTQGEVWAAQAKPTSAGVDAADIYRLVLVRNAIAPASPEAASSAAAGTAPTTAPASTPQGTGATPALSPGTRFRDCQDDTVCPWLVVLPAGNFLMGSPESEKGRVDDEGPQHPVTLARPFALMEAEVTREQFAAYLKETGRAPVAGCFALTADSTSAEISVKADWRQPGFAQDDSHPVVCVSWNDAKGYADWLSAKTSQSYRLPSEAEWEYAARAGSGRRYSFGDDATELCRHGNVADRSYGARFPKASSWAATCDDGQVFTAPVKRYAPSAFGLYDMHGNVWEWVADCWHRGYDGAPSDGSVWSSDCGKEVRPVIRGGGWGSIPDLARSAIRDRGAPVILNYVGFRLVRTLAP